MNYRVSKYGKIIYIYHGKYGTEWYIQDTGK